LDCLEKEIYMSRLYKLLLVSALALIILACNLITGPINEVGNVAETAQAFASEMPFETVQALATAIPVQTFEALPSAIPDFEGYFVPTGTPTEQWNVSSHKEGGMWGVGGWLRHPPTPHAPIY